MSELVFAKATPAGAASWVSYTVQVAATLSENGQLDRYYRRSSAISSPPNAISS
jgi:hypothetical protein